MVRQVELDCEKCEARTVHSLIDDQWRCIVCNSYGHRCGWDCASVHVSKIVYVEVHDEYLDKTRSIGVCPCCAEHKRGDCGDYIDCKNVFWDGHYYDEREKRMIRKSVGQCMCYGPAHGVRK